MSTYCRITGRSRGLPKPHYFPLLPPISPADARRICRITGKSYGLPTHHFIPVLTSASRTRTKPCQITSKSEGHDPHHYAPASVKHVVQKGFRYLAPLLEANAELMQILEGKPLDENNRQFIYTIDENKCTLVLPGQLESAIRDGDVRDLMLSKDSDQILIKLRKGPTIELNVKDCCMESMDLFEGEGPSKEAFLKRKKRKPNDNTDWRRKIFEDKEKEAMSEEVRLSEIKSKRIKVKLEAWKEHPVFSSWKNVRIEPTETKTDDQFHDQLKNVLRGLQDNQQDLNHFVNVTGKPIVNTLPQPIKVESQIVDLSHSLPGIIQQPIVVGNSVTGFPVAKIVAPFQPFVEDIDPKIVSVLKEFNANKPALYNILQKQNAIQAKQAASLPSLENVPELVKSLRKFFEKGTQNGNKNNKSEKGLKLLIGDVEKYVPGQFLKTDKGEIFVPGNVVETSTGPTFVPGLVLRTDQGNKFLPGFIFKDEANTPVFVAGQNALTRHGEKFVQGQVLQTNDGARFMPGQTVITPEGVKFIPGQIVSDQKCKDGHRFVPGQIIMTSEGPQFVTGYFSQNLCTSEVSFVAGQSVLNENCNWEFIPGQNMKTEDGGYVFVAGKEMMDHEEQNNFVPGQMVIDEGGVELFVPGITVNDESGNIHFIPGMEVETKNGSKFVEGVIAAKDDGTLAFAAGKVIKNERDVIEFENAKNADDLIFHDVHSGMTLNAAAVSSAEGTEVYGHLVQSAQGVEFFPGEAAGLPAGKVIPGKLVRGKQIRFIPGTMSDGKFTPGQFITTDTEEKFIPGQVIETNEGPKFVPGQVLQTRTGPKFVPGQTMETENGPKFIPGQIIETKRGPTFIPGQVIFTEEEGSRFVPGQVVDTVEGPRFVPGRVIETGDHVTFIPGQIVETEEGLKFIAPDLEDDPEGGYHFTVQGFEVAPEEVNLIGNSIPHACFIGEMAVDAKTLQQLAEAGMAVGRQLPVDIPSVNIRSLPVTEAACRIAHNLDIDATQSVKMSHILSTLQQVKQAGVSLTPEEIGDDSLEALVYLAMESEHNKESYEFLQMLGDALEDTIKIDENKVESIDLLHKLSANLARKVREKATLINTVASQLGTKLNIDSAYVQGKVSQILSNLEHIKKSNVFIPRKEIKDKNLKMLLNLVSDCDPEAIEHNLLKNLATALENTVQVDPNHCLETIETLCNLTDDLVSKARTKMLSSIGIAHAVTNNLDMDPANAVKINHILANLQEIKKSKAIFTKEELNDENLQVLLNIVQSFDSSNEDENMQALASVLEDTLKLNPSHTLDAIEKLHKLTATIAKKANKNSGLISNAVKDMAKKFNMSEENSNKLNNIVTGLMKVKNSNDTSLANKMDNEDVKALISLVQDNKNLSNEDFLEVLGNQLASITNPHNIDLLQASTADIVCKLDNKTKLKSETALTIANELEMTPEYLIKMVDILSNLHEIKQAEVAIDIGDINNKNLEVLLNLAKGSDVNKDDAVIIKKLSTALINTLNVDPEQKLQIVDQLHSLTSNLVNEVQNKVITINKTASDIARKINVDKPQSAKIAQILSNLEQIKLLNLKNEFTEDENLKNLFETVLQADNVESKQFLEKTSIALENILSGDLENKLESINNLEELTHTLVNNAENRSKKVTESACAIAKDLSVSAPQLVKIGKILSNLQVIKKSNAAILSDDMNNGNLELLLNLAMACDGKEDGPEGLKAFAAVLEKTLKLDKENKVQTIDNLDELTSNLALDSLKKSMLTKQSANIIANNLDLGEKQAVQLSQILSNLQQLGLSNIQLEESDKDLQTLLNIAKQCSKDVTQNKEFLQLVGGHLEEVLKENSEHKCEIIDILQKKSANIISKDQEKSKLTTETAFIIANDLNLNTPHLVQLNHILSDLQNIQKSGIVISNDAIMDENLELILKLGLACNTEKNQKEVMKTLAYILQNTIQIQPEQKLNTIENLHMLTADLTKVTHAKSEEIRQAAVNFAENYDLEPQSAKLNQILFNIQHIISSNCSNTGNSVILDQNVEEFMNTILRSNIDDTDSQTFQEVVLPALEKFIKSDIKNKSLNIDTLHSVTSDLNNRIQSQSLLTTEIALAMGNDLSVSTPQVVQISHILSNLQQIKETNFNVSKKDMTSDNVEMLINLALISDDETCTKNIIQAFGSALQKIVKNEDLTEKISTITELHDVTSLLVNKAAEKFSIYGKEASRIAAKLQLDKPYTKKLCQILANLQEMQISKMDISSLKITDQNLKLLIQTALKSDLGENDSKFLQRVGHVLESRLSKDMEHRLQNTDLIYAFTCEVVSKGRKQALLNIETAFIVSNELDLQKPQTVKINHILSNLQKIQNANLAIAHHKFEDNETKLLLGLAQVSADNEGPEFINLLADAILKTIAINPRGKVEIIDQLDKMTSSLIEEIPGKISLKRKIAEAVKENLNLDDEQLFKVEQILSNLQQIKSSNINPSKEDIENKVVEHILKNCQMCDIETGDIAFLEAVGSILQQEVTQANLEDLYEITNKLASKAKDYTLLTAQSAYSLGTDLNIKTPELVKIGQILSNLHKFKTSNVALPADLVANADLEVLLSLATADNNLNNSEDIKSLAVALQKTFNISSQNLVPLIDSLNLSTNKTAVLVENKIKALEKVVDEVINKLNIEKVYSPKMCNVISNLQLIILNNVDRQELEQIDNEEAKKLLIEIIQLNPSNGDQQDIENIVQVLEKMVNFDPDKKLQTLETLHHVTKALIAQIHEKSRITLAAAIDVVNDLNLTDAHHMIQVSHILTNLQHMNQSNFMVAENANIQNDNVKLLMNLALASTNESNSLNQVKTFAEALCKTLNLNSQETPQTLDILKNSIRDLAVKACVEHKLVQQIANQMEKDLNIDESHSGKLGQILSNLQCLKLSQLPIDIQTVEGKLPKSLIEIIINNNNETSNSNFKIQAKAALESIIRMNPEAKLQIVDSLYGQTSDLVTKLNNFALMNTKIAYDIANEMNVNAPHLIQMSDILTNLKQLKQVDFMPECHSKDNSLELLMNLALVSNSEKKDSMVLENLANALKKIAKLENTGNTINTLHHLTTILAAQGKEKNQLVVDTATNIAKACFLDEKQVKKVEKILMDVQRIKYSKINLTKQNIPDKKLCVLLNDIINTNAETATGPNSVQAIGAIIQKVLLSDIDCKNQNIDSLYAVVSNIATKARNKALLLNETAYTVGQELNMGMSQVVKVGHILSNLCNIKESHMSIPINVIEDNSLELLLTLALPCNTSKPGDQTIKMLADVLKNTINTDLEQKIEIVDNLFTLTTDLAKSTALESNLIETKAAEMVHNLNVGEAYFIKLCDILSNLHQIKLSKIDISQHVIKNENWKALIDSILLEEDDLKDAEFYKSLANTVENLIRANPEHKLQNINSLHAVLNGIITKESNKIYLTTSTAYNMAKELGVNTVDLMKISHILSDLQGLNQADVAILESDITDNKVQVLLNLALANNMKNSDAEMMKTLYIALQNTIQVDGEENSLIIDSLHTHTAELSNKVHEKVLQVEEMARQLATKLGMDTTNTVKLSNILSILEKIAMTPVDFEKENIKNSEIKNLLQSILHRGNQIMNLKSLTNLLEDFFKKDSEHQSHNLDELHCCLSKLNAKINTKVGLLTENALQVASHLDLGIEGTIKMAKILSNVQQIKQADVALLPNEIENKNLELLLNLAPACENQTSELELDYIKKLKGVLQSTIKMDLDHKDQMIEKLFALTTDANTKVTQKAQKFKEYGQMLGSELNLDQESSTKLTSFLSDLQHIAQSNIDIGQEINNADVKMLLQVSKECANENDENFVKIVGKSLDKVLRADIDHKVDNVDVLSKKVSELATKLTTNKLQAATTSQAVAFNLELKAPEAVQMSDVLLNLQHLSQMRIPLALNDIQNEDIKLIVNLAVSNNPQNCDNPAELVPTLGHALEKLMELRPELRSNTINLLHSTAANLVKEVDHVSMLINNATENLAKNLKIDQSVKEKVRSIFIGLLSVKQSNIEVPQEYIKHTFLETLLNVITEVGSKNEELVQGISQALESIIKANIDQKQQIINEVDAAITDLVADVKSMSVSPASMAYCITNNLKINASSAVSINELISDMKRLKKMQAFISNADIEDQNIKLLFNHILAIKGDVENSELLQTLADAIEYTVKVEKNDKMKNIDELQSITAQLVLVGQSRSALIEETALKLASKLKVDSSKVSKILSNLQQIRKSSICVSIEDIPNKDVHALVNFALESDDVNDVQFFGALGELLEKMIKANVQQKSQTIDSLCAITTDLASGIWDRALVTAETAHNIANSLNMDALSINVSNILSNLQQIKSLNIPISVNKVQDGNLKLLLNIAMAYDGDVDGSDFVQVLGHALKNTINLEPNQAIETLTKFHTLIDDLSIKAKDQSCTIKEIATKVAGNLKVESSTISDIITNLKEAYLYNLASLEDIENEDLKALLNLASECGYDYEEVEFFKVLGDAIENIIEIDLDHKSQKIDTLHALSTKLASAARQKALLITSMACKMVDKLNIDPSHSVTISRILTNLQEISESGFIFPSADITDKNMALLLKQITNAEAGKEECQLLSELGQTLENMIAADPKHKLEIINSLQAQSNNILKELGEKPPNKVQLLKSLIKNNFELRDDVVEKLSSILDANEMAMCVAFRNMSRENPDFVDKVLRNTASILNDKRIDEKKAVETLHRAIVKAVGETSEHEVTQVLRQKEGNDFRSLVVDASGLAKALGMNEVVHVLDGILNDSRSMPVFAKDKIVIEVLKRLTVMRQLAEKQPTLRAALHDLQYDPYAARNDPRLRALVRDSAVLMVIPEESLILRSSADVPCSLLFGDNTLAVEDFMVKSRQTGKTFLILKKGVQMVVPREAARDVLTGKVPYTVLDENGISHFTPLHVFNALKLPRVATNRFSNYGYSPKMSEKSKAKDKASEKELLLSRCSSVSVDESHKNFPNGSCSTQEVIIDVKALQYGNQAEQFLASAQL